MERETFFKQVQIKGRTFLSSWERNGLVHLCILSRIKQQNTMAVRVSLYKEEKSMLRVTEMWVFPNGHYRDLPDRHTFFRHSVYDPFRKRAQKKTDESMWRRRWDLGPLQVLLSHCIFCKTLYWLLQIFCKAIRIDKWVPFNTPAVTVPVVRKQQGKFPEACLDFINSYEQILIGNKHDR